MYACMLSRVWLFATPWTVAVQAPRPWDFPGKNTEVGCHCLLQEIFLTQESNSCLLCHLHSRPDSFPLNHLCVVHRSLVLSLTFFLILSVILSSLSWVGQNVNSGFPYHLMEKPKWTFGQPNASELLEELFKNMHIQVLYLSVSWSGIEPNLFS